MDIDILFWLLIAALPIISGFLEKRRKQQGPHQDADMADAGERGSADGVRGSAAGRVARPADQHDPELGSALEEIRRVLAGETEQRREEPTPHWEQRRVEPAPRRSAPAPPREQRPELPEPHWEQRREEPAPHWEQKSNRPSEWRDQQEARRAERSARESHKPQPALDDPLPHSPLLASPENLMHLPMPSASGKIEVEEALTTRSSRQHVPTTPKEIRHAIILADVLGTPRFKNRHRPF